MRGINRLQELVRQLLPVGLLGLGHPGDDGGVGVGLVALEPQDVVSIGHQDRVGRPRLAVDGIGRDDAPPQIEQLQERWYCRDLVRVGVHCPLAEHEASMGCEGADQQPWRLTRIVGAAQRFPVHSHNLMRQRRQGRAHQRQKAANERVWIETSEDATERVMRRDTTRQAQERREPVLLGCAEQLDLDPRVGSTDDGTGRDRHDGEQLVDACARNPWVREISEVLGDGQM
jgi:hypothetical protein